MARVQNAILTPGAAYGMGANAPMLNLQYGGMMGFAPEFGEWVSNQAYIQKPLIPILIEAPAAIQYMPNPDVILATLRALVELHPVSIDGLNATLQVDVTDSPFGGSGLTQQDIVNVKETPSTPNFHYIEKYGRAIQRFWRIMITYLGMDPYTKFSNLATLSTAANIGDLLADQYAMTVLFIEPDPLFSKVVQSWLVTNMFPKGTGDVQGRMDKTQDGSTLQIEIPFTGLHQYGAGVDAFAQTILSGLSVVGANPFMRNAFINQITADVAAAGGGDGVGGTGFKAGIANLAGDQITNV